MRKSGMSACVRGARRGGVFPRLGLLSALLWAPACSDNNNGPADQAADQSSPAGDLAGSCIGQSECACLASPSCQPIAEACWCPSACDGRTCLCGGGRFFGCAPRASGCAPTVTCGPAGRTSQDAAGCVTCTLKTDCAQAAEALKDGCPQKRMYLDGLSCARAPDCVLRCINAVRTCEDVGCGLCTTCRCINPGVFEQCVAKC